MEVSRPEISFCKTFLLSLLLGVSLTPLLEGCDKFTNELDELAKADLVTSQSHCEEIETRVLGLTESLEIQVALRIVCDLDLQEAAGTAWESS